MTGPAPGTTPPPQVLICRVCGTENPATRQFCRKCAADLRAPVAAPGEELPREPEPTPIRPILIGGGIALLAVLALVGLFLAFGGVPAASPSPTGALPSGPSASGQLTFAPGTTEPTDAPTEPAATTPGTPRPARIREFSAPETVDCDDPGFSGFVEVSWVVVRADGVTISIDGPGIYASYDALEGSAVVPYSCGTDGHTYLLTTVGGVGEPDTEERVIRDE